MMILKSLITVLIFTGARLTECARKKDTTVVLFENITSTYNPKNSDEFSIDITPHSSGRSFDLRWNLTAYIKNEMHLDIDLGIHNAKDNSFTSVFKYDFDVCRLWDGFMGGTIARMWFKNLKKFGNFPLVCPVKKGYYFMNKFKIDKGSIPPLVPPGKLMGKVKMFIKRGAVKDELFYTIIQIKIL